MGLLGPGFNRAAGSDGSPAGGVSGKDGRSPALERRGGQAGSTATEKLTVEAGPPLINWAAYPSTGTDVCGTLHKILLKLG
jgi:hypothetical protein